MRLPPSPLSDDAEFLRRVHLDLIGRLPTAEEARTFSQRAAVGCESGAALIAALLEREEFVDFWTMKFGDWLLISGKRGGEAATRTLSRVGARAVGAQPSARPNACAIFCWRRATPAESARRISTRWPAIRAISASTSAACFSARRSPARAATRIPRIAGRRTITTPSPPTSRGSRSRAAVVASATRGEVEHPKTRKPVAPRPLGGARRQTAERERSPRPLADWLIASRQSVVRPQSRQSRLETSARARTRRAGGRSAPDESRRRIPPCSTRWRRISSQHGFDLPLARARDRRVAHVPTHLARTRRPTAATTSSSPMPISSLCRAGVRGCRRAGHRRAGSIFRITRRARAPCSSSARRRLPTRWMCWAAARASEAARRRAGRAAASRRRCTSSTARRSTTSCAAARCHNCWPRTCPRAIIDELYLRALSRPATAAERAAWEPLLAADADRAACEDLLWALLNSREFSFNH